MEKCSTHKGFPDTSCEHSKMLSCNSFKDAGQLELCLTIFGTKFIIKWPQPEPLYINHNTDC